MNTIPIPILALLSASVGIIWVQVTKIIPDPLFILIIETIFVIASVIKIYKKYDKLITETNNNTSTLADDDSNDNINNNPEMLAAQRAGKRIIQKARDKYLSAAGGFIPKCSQQVQDYLVQASQLFDINVSDSPVNSEGMPWKVQYHDPKREIKISSSELPGQSCKRWKVEAVLAGDLESAYNAVFEPSMRSKWDALVQDIALLRINDCEPHVGDGLAVSFITTAAAAGGLVASRTMLDFGLQKTVKTGGINIINASIPPDFPEYHLGPPPGEGGKIRAISHPGSGCSLLPIPGRRGVLQYVLISTIDLKGSLNPYIVNSAMTSSLAQGTRQMQDYLVKNVDLTKFWSPTIS
jgi:hypothetical protein